MGEAFFEPLGGGRFHATEHTAGPWTPDAQHLGPASALLVRALEALPASTPSAIARVTVEILGPVPIAELAVSAEVERPGRSVELLSGEISAGGRAVARAKAWRMVRSDSSEVAGGAGDPLAPPEQASRIMRPDGWSPGYLDVMEWRSLRGSFEESGPATVWARQQVDLVAGEEPTGLQRLFTAADSGSGISNRLNPAEWWFINSELTIHVFRHPDGDWIGLDSHTVIGPHGVGTALSTVHDRHGPLGTCTQALLVRRR